MKFLLIAGARPNFMKIAPIYREALKYADVQCEIVHTGQHYDHTMSQTFFDELELPPPRYQLNTGSGSHAVQTAKVMIAFEGVCNEAVPDCVIIVGDVNSALACGIVSKKLNIQVAHVEAGLRSFDRSMPEEINRIVADSISDYFFVTEESGSENLLREGKQPERIHLVGNVMIDNLFHQLRNLQTQQVSRFPSAGLKARHSNYAFLTLHRPSNVDVEEVFKSIAEAINRIAHDRAVFFPVHPRTRKIMEAFRITFCANVFLLPPMGFREALSLWKDAAIVLTDSGGLQEETTALGVPCLTLRENTERPITTSLGSNRLAGTQARSILDAYHRILQRGSRHFSVPPLWDGKASERIWSVLRDGFSSRTEKFNVVRQDEILSAHAEGLL